MSTDTLRQHYEKEDIGRNEYLGMTIFVVVGWDPCSKEMIRAFYNEEEANTFCTQCNKKPPPLAFHKTFRVERVVIT